METPFYDYKAGVFAADCVSGGSAVTIGLLNHAVLVVGFGADPATGQLFWKARRDSLSRSLAPRPCDIRSLAMQHLCAARLILSGAIERFLFRCPAVSLFDFR